MILAIYCGGGLGREVLELAYQINDVKHKWDKIIFVDDVIPDDRIQGIEKFSFEEFKKIHTPNEAKFVIATGEPRNRDILYTKVKNCGYNFDTLIHPDVRIPDTTTLGEGVVVNTGALISCNVTVGNNVFFQPYCTIGHDAKIADSCVISGFTAVSGHCEIGRATYIAVHSAVKQEIKIGSNCIVGMGAMVLRNVEDKIIVLGNPARIIGTNDEGKVF